MLIPRFFVEQVLNNVALTAAAAAVVLLVTLVVTAMLRGLIRGAARSLRSAHVDRAGDRVGRALGVLAASFAVLTVVVACLTLGIASVSGIDLYTWMNRLAGYATAYTGPSIGPSLALGAAVAAGWLLLRRLLHSLLLRLETALLSAAPLAGQQARIAPLWPQARSLADLIILYALYRIGSAWVSLSADVHWLLSTVLLVLIIACFARAAALVAVLAIEALDSLGASSLEHTPLSVYYAGIHKLSPLAQRMLEAIIYLAAATVIVRRFETLAVFASFGPRIIRLLITFFAARVAVELSRVLLFQSLVGSSTSSEEAAKRLMTLASLLQSIATYVIYFGAVLLMMNQVGIDTKPFLAGAGIIGLAVGLGAQRLVNDMVSGFFILFEGHLLKGDYVRIGEAQGTVDSVQLRVTTIRDSSGRLFTFRNGDLGTLINFSREYVCSVVDVPVAHQNNLSQVYEALLEAGRRLADAHADRVRDKLVVQGVNQIVDNGLVVRVRARLSPGDPDPISRALRKLIKETFDERGIQMANGGQIEVSFKDGQPMPK